MFRDEFSHGRNKRGELRPKNRTLSQIDKPMRTRFAKTKDCAVRSPEGMKRSPAAALNRREMLGQNFADLYALPTRCIDDPIADKSPQHLLIRMLKLAASADCKVAARRINMMIAPLNPSIGCDRIAWYGESDVLP
ncbi:hypothetical protein NAP1_06140 [Erythrobacter sp. NAP1]|nr:hypothetical protein NAP1_06140 [Erythrobacter sp. NAP1]